MRIAAIGSALIGLLAIGASAMNLPIDGDFAASDAKGFPTNWVLHSTYEPYLPLATVNVVSEGGINAIHYYNAQGASGSALRAKQRHPALIGDVVTITFEAKGSGTARASIYCYGSGNAWVGACDSASFTLDGAWRSHRVVLTVKEVEGKPAVAELEAVLDIGHGTDAYFRNVRFSRELETAEYRMFDDYESERSRSGSPEIFSREVSAGLLSATKVAAYRTSSTSGLAIADDSAGALPGSDGRNFLQFGLRLYSLEGSKANLRQNLVYTSTTLVLGFIPISTDHKLNFDLVNDGDSIACELDGTSRLTLSKSLLPADFVLSASGNGTWNVSAKSLADSSVHEASGALSFFSSAGDNAISRKLSLVSGSGKVTAVATIDNVFIATALVGREGEITYPYTARPAATFDPVAAGWPLTFADEFNGYDYDRSKWQIGNDKFSRYLHVGGGILRVEANHDEANPSTVATASIYSRRTFKYGYFESRLRFTRKPGWWAAFWLCSRINGLNPFVDGFEIDIFEDYTTRVESPSLPPIQKLDHNLHIRGNGALKSWNYNSSFGGRFGTDTDDDWHVIGCKWTPFEVTYYMDGVAIPSSAAHSPYATVTFDAFRHGACVIPINAIISGVSMATKTFGIKDMTGYDYPEYFDVDYVRVYAYPDGEAGRSPTVRLTEVDSPGMMVPVGTTLNFLAEPTPAAVGQSPIRAVHLFDDGFYLSTVSNPPYAFSVTLDEQHLATTQWMRPGRQNDQPSSMTNLIHAFAAFVEAADGKVWHSDVIMHLTAISGERSTPYEGKAAKVPGSVVLGRYDAGGNGVGYYDTTVGNVHSTTWRPNEDVDCTQTSLGTVAMGEWLNYTIDVERSAVYRLSIPYGTPVAYGHRLLVFCDNQPVCDFSLACHDRTDYYCDCVAEGDFEMKAGRHVIKLMFFGAFNIGSFKFTEVAPIRRGATILMR